MPRDAVRGQGRRDGRADTAVADHQRALALGVETLARHAPDEPGAVELVAEQRPVLAQQHGVGGTGHLGGRRQLVDQLGGRHLVRHGDQGAADVRQLEQQREELAVLLAP